MIQFFTTTLGTVISLGAILTVSVAGLLFLIGIFSKQKRVIKEEEDKDGDRLINILKATVDQLEEKVNKQTKDIEALTVELHKFKEDNERYIKIFQGRDEQTQEFYKRSYAAMDLDVQTHDIMTTVAKSIADTNATMNRMVDLLSKSVDVVGKVAGNK